MLPTNPVDDDHGASLGVQREAGVAIRLSLEPVIGEPLPGGVQSRRKYNVRIQSGGKTFLSPTENCKCLYEIE